MNRQSGRTTRQIITAPEGAVFVWCNSNTDYPMRIAHRLERTDIKVVSLQWLLNRRFVSADRRQVILDHAVVEQAGGKTAEVIEECNAVMKARFKGS